MVWSKPYDEVEISFIKASYPQLGCAEIAAKLGRSERGVRNAVKRLGLAASCARVTRAHSGGSGDPPDDGGKQDELAELRELKRVLKRTLKGEVDPRAMPKLSAELREVITRIGELEGGGNAAGKPGGLGDIIGFVPVRPA